MLKRGWQFGALVALVALAACAWPQTPAQVVPAASVGDDFSVYHQSLANAADVALANVAREVEISTQTDGIATDSTAQPDETILHQFAQQYWNGNDEAVRRAVERVTQLRPMLSPILHEEGIPDEIAALVLVESAGQLTALSPKGARGIWQFMPDTARRYGLVVTADLDERIEVVKSTRAAACYLRDLYKRFGDWRLAFAAYNAGEEAVERAVTRTGHTDFSRIDRALPGETRTYILAVMHAMELLGTNKQEVSPVFKSERSPARSVLYASTKSAD
jgi:transglycosylase-like protein with SLT domain